MQLHSLKMNSIGCSVYLPAGTMHLAPIPIHVALLPLSWQTAV